MKNNQKKIWGIPDKSWVYRCLWMYLIVGLAIFGLINKKTVAINRLNFLVQNEKDVEAFSAGQSPRDSNALKMTIRYYRALLDFIPPDGVVYGNMGFCYFYLKDYPRALQEYQQAIALEPALGTLRWDLAMILFVQGHFKSAIPIWEEYLNSQDSMIKYFTVLEQDLISMKREDMLPFVKILRKRFVQDELQAYIHLSEAYFYLRKYAQASETALNGLKLFPQDHWLYNLAGLADFKAGRFEKAAESFKAIIANDPRNVNAYYYRGACMRALGDKRQEAQDVAQVRKLLAAGIKPEPMFKENAKLHFNTEIVFLRYRLK